MSGLVKMGLKTFSTGQYLTDIEMTCLLIELMSMETILQKTADGQMKKSNTTTLNAL